MDRRSQVLLGLGLALLVAVAAAIVVTVVPSGPTLAATWISEPPEGAGGNHHGPAIGTVEGQPMVFAPVSAPRRGPACQLMAIEADRGTVRWRHQVPATACTVHAIADPAFATWQGQQAVLVTTTENALFVLDPASGEVRERYALPAYGYTPPVVADLSPTPGEELLVVDARGTIQVIGANGSVVWTEALGTFVWTEPIVADVSGGGETQLALGTSDGRLLVYDGSGGLLRRVTAPFNGSITWLTSGQLDDDPALELVAATTSGEVVSVDGATGRVEWRRNVGSFAAVGPVGDADGDGVPEVYATAADGRVRSLEGPTGRTIWDRAVAAEPVQMMPPPAFGDVTGDDVEELVVASNDGRVVALDPASGTRAAAFERDGTVFERPSLADVDGDPALEVFVIYADGRVVRLDYDA